MSFFNNLPAPLQSVIQQGYLQRTWDQALKAKLGFRVVADRFPFPAGVGQTLTRTKMGLLRAVTDPIGSRPVRVQGSTGLTVNQNPPGVTDLDDGLTDAAYGLEQYSISVDPYANTMTLNLSGASQAIEDIYLQNAYALGENAARSMDLLCYRALYNGYMGYNTWTTATLGSAGDTIAVNDVRGFFESVSPSTGKVVKTSTSNPITVKVGANLYSLKAVVADGVAPASINNQFTNLDFLGSGSNTSTVQNLGGYSGTLQFTTSVSTSDSTAGNTVVASIAPSIIRPYDPTTGVMRANATKLVAGDVLTMRMVRNAAALMRSNAIDGDLWCFTDDVMMQSLFNDTEFRQYFQGQPNTSEYSNGIITRVMGINFVRTNISYNDTSTVANKVIHRAIVVSQGALVEADYTAQAYANGVQDEVSEIAITDNVAHITRPPLNRLADVVSQTWGAYVGLACPTDVTANPETIPTASNASRKRAIILESMEQ